MIMRFFAFLICILFINSSGFSQDAEVQKLLAGKTDTTSIKKLMDYASTLVSEDYEKARKLFTISLQKSEEIHYTLGVANSYFKLAKIAGNIGQHREAVQYLLTTIPILEKANRFRGLILCYNNIGVNYEILGKTDSALHYYLKGVSRLENQKTESDLLALLYENVGTLYGNFSELDKALQFATKSVALAREIKDTARLTTALTCVAYIHNRQQQYEKGLAAAREARGLVHIQDNKTVQAKVYYHLAGAFVGLKQADSAIKAAKQSMEIAETNDQAIFVAVSMDLADALEQKKDYTGEKAVLLKMMKLVEANQSLLSLYLVYEALSRVYYQLGDTKQAYIYSEKRNQAKDQFTTEQRQHDVVELEVKYRTALKEKALSEKQLQLTQKDLQLQRNRQYMILAAVGLLVISLIAIGIYIYALNRRKVYTSQLIALQKQKEIERLDAIMQGEEKERSRIAKDLHDGVAGILTAAKLQLGSIAVSSPVFTHSKAYTQAISLLDEAHQEVRKTSHNLMPEVLLKYGLDEALKRYCAAISTDILDVQYASIGEATFYSERFELALYRIVQELLGNVIKHAKATKAYVQLSTHEDCLLLEVQDNGTGFAAASSLTSIGLQSLQSRVQALSGHIAFESSKTGLSVSIEFNTTGLEK